MLIVLGVLIVVFFIKSIVHLSPAFIALAVGGALLRVGPKNSSKAFDRIEWVILTFFVPLIVIAIEAELFLMSDSVRWPRKRAPSCRWEN